MPVLTSRFHFADEHDEQQNPNERHGRSLNHLDVDQRISQT